MSTAAAMDPLSADGLVITPSAARRVLELTQSSGSAAVLRVEVTSGGCSGFKYAFTVETEAPAEEDIVFTRDGAKVVVDNISLGKMKGATLNWADDMAGSMFQIVNNPHASSGCGCGSSFSSKE